MDFLNSLLDSQQIMRTALLALLLYLAVAIACSIDLISARRYTRRLGIELKSKGMRRTIRKYNDYANFMATITVADVLLVAFGVYGLAGIPTAPWLTLGASLVPIGIEAYSVYEKTEKKRKKDIKTAVDSLVELVRTKGDPQAVLEYLQAKLQAEEELDKPEPLTPDYPND